jgi:thioredoxin 1
MTSSAIITATDADFDEKMKTGKPTLLDFWATWCGPCKQVAPILDQIADEHPEYAVVKVDIEQAPETAKRLGIIGVPFIAILKADGTVVSGAPGAKPKQALLDSLATAV